MLAARLDNTTTPRACDIAAGSCSMSSYVAGRSSSAPTMRWTNRVM